MADKVQWIRLMVGAFDGESFKKIKRAKIGGVSYRDKLTAVWYELLDLAGKCNANGCLIGNNGIPYQSDSDIATMLDREDNEITLCMGFFLSEKMVEIINGTYTITNFVKYQNQEGLEKIRAQNRERQAKLREKRKQALLSSQNNDNVSDNVIGNDDGNVTSRDNKAETTESNADSVTRNVTSRDSSYSNSYSTSNSYSSYGGGKENNKNNGEVVLTRACVREEPLTVEKFEQFADCEGWERYPNGEVYREIRDAAFKLIDDGEMTIEDISHELITQILDSMYVGRERRQIVDLPKYILAIVKRLRKTKVGE